MIPRGPAAVTAVATSSAVRGTTTCAVLGAVRPQPCSLWVLVGVLDIGSQATRRPRTVRPGPGVPVRRAHPDDRHVRRNPGDERAAGSRRSAPRAPPGLQTSGT